MDNIKLFGKILEQKGYDVDRLGKLLNKIKKIKKQEDVTSQLSKVAIVGLGCRFPNNIHSPEMLWESMINQKIPDSNIKPSRFNLKDFYSNNKELNKIYINKAMMLDDIYSFDPLFFGISPKEVMEIDPQYRLLIEVAWESLENAGISLEQAQKVTTGVFVGIGTDDYTHLSLQSENLDNFNNYTLLGGNRGFGVGRISYLFGFSGPSQCIDTTCSSSLVAVHSAIQSLILKESDMALAGGVNLILSPLNIMGRCHLGVLSKKGECRVFDDKADGFVQGEGCGMVVLKRLEDAIRDQDIIYSVIAASAVNQNGGGNGIQAPNGEAQKILLRTVLSKGNLSGNDIDYIEAHGTGTELGDPIEVDALAEVYGKDRHQRNPILIGSVKALYGHLEPAAGILSMIKTALCLYHGKIPGQVNLSELNRHIKWEGSGVKVVTGTIDWPQTGRLPRAGVSSFGINGTNAHAILEKFANIERINIPEKNTHYVLPIAAKNKESLNQYVKKYLNYFNDNLETIQDICYTASVGRSHFNFRACFVGDNKNNIMSSMLKFIQGTDDDKYMVGSIDMDYNENLVFVFSGQCARVPNMGRELYYNYDVYRLAIEDCNTIYRHKYKQDIKDVLFNNDIKCVNEVHHIYASTFSHNYALFKLWESIGVTPKAVIGHGIGEYLAVYAAKIINFQDCFNLLLDRADIMETLVPIGNMLLVFLSESEFEEIKTELEIDVNIASINTPHTLMLSGSQQDLEKLETYLIENNIYCKWSHNLFSYSEDDLNKASLKMEKYGNKINYKNSDIEVILNLTGNILNKGTFTYEYWMKQMFSPQFFYKGIQTLLNKGHSLFLEIGGEPILSRLIQQIPHKLVTIDSQVPEQQLLSFAKAIGKLYCNGIKVNWESLFVRDTYKKVSVPSYPLNKTSFINRRNLIMQNHASNQLNCTKDSADIGFLDKLKEIIAELTQLNRDQIDPSLSLLAFGLDSFVMISLTQRIKKTWNVNITIRELFESFNTIEKIHSFILSSIDLQKFSKSDIEDSVFFDKTIELCDSFQSLKKDELIIVEASETQEVFESACNQKNIVNSSTEISKLEKAESMKENDRKFSFELQIPRFNAINFSDKLEKKIKENNLKSLTPQQQDYLNKFILNYNKKTIKSKIIAEESRSYLCNNRKSSSGFRYETKELNYPIIASSSYKSKIKDIDGNEYIDLAMGFGANLFGHNPDFIKIALHEQINKGYQIGPESEYALECSKIISEISKKDKVLFANSGTEAIMTAIRIARAYRKKNKIVIFHNSYHGHFDSTLVTANHNDSNDFCPEPMCQGIPKSLVHDVIFLPFDTDKSIDEIILRKDSIAAVVVEPVQNRNPGLHPGEFLKKLRNTTRENNISLIFDEILVGFRVAAGGAQEWFNIDADLVTYGKIVGGGLPIGVIAGKKEHMDVVDGGIWHYGDHSEPKSDTTYTAGTFCKHPLAMIACYNVLKEIKKQGKQLYDVLNKRSEAVFNIINDIFIHYNVPLKIFNFGSFFRFAQSGNLSFFFQPLELDIFFYNLIEKGIYVWESKTCFISTEHTDEDMDILIEAVHSTVLEMINVGFWNGGSSPSGKRREYINETGIDNTKKNSYQKSSTMITDLGCLSTKIEPIISSDFVSSKNIHSRMEFSLYFFGDYYNYEQCNPYDLIMEVAKYADKSGFKAVWVPERHFSSFGGFSPNPSILGAAIARETKNIELRGSVVSPLQHPIRIAEEWSVVQRLSSSKKVGLAFAPGWQANDFVLNPVAWPPNKENLYDNINIVKALWKGNICDFKGVNNVSTPIEIFPKPFDNKLPIWITTLGNSSVYEKAGELGVGIITNLLGQDIKELQENISIYKQARQRVGLDPEDGHIAILIHTLVCQTDDEANEYAKIPFCNYLLSSIGLFQKMAKLHNLEVNFDNLSKEDREYLVFQAYKRLSANNSLIGSVDHCKKLVNKLILAGVSEIACFLDFGVDSSLIKKCLPYLEELKNFFSNNFQDLEEKEAKIRTKRIQLTPDQSHLLMVEKINDNGKYVNNLTLAFEIEGNIDINVLEEAYKLLARQHASLRVSINDEMLLHQTFNAFQEVKLEFIKLEGINHKEKFEKINQFIENDNNRVCNLAESSHRLQLLEVDGNTYILVINVHHAVCDGMSLGILTEDLGHFYNEIKKNKKINLREQVQYDEFVEWRIKQSIEDSYNKQYNYWFKELEKQESSLALPIDYLRPKFKTYKGSTVNIVIQPEIYLKISSLAKEHNVTPFMVMLTMYSILLHMLCRQNEVTIGVHFDGRSIPGSEKIIGFCNNLYPINIIVNPDDRILDALNQVRSKMLDAFENKDLPFSSLLEISKIKNQREMRPLFNTAFNWEDISYPPFEGLDIKPFNFKKKYVRHDLMVNIVRSKVDIVISIEYSHDLFKDSNAQYIADCYYNILAKIDSTCLIRNMQLLNCDSFKEQLSYLKSVASVQEGYLELPIDKIRPKELSKKRKIYSMPLDNMSFEKLKKLADLSNSNPYTIFIAALNILLYRYTGYNNILMIVYNYLDKTKNEDLESTFFILKTSIKETNNFQEILLEVTNSLLEMKRDKLLIDTIDSDYDITENDSVFQIGVNKKDVNSNEKISYNLIEKHDVCFCLTQDQNIISLDIDYSEDLFEIDTIRRVAEHFGKLLEEISKNTQIKISDYIIINDQEKNIILDKNSNTLILDVVSLPIGNLFEDKVNKFPNEIAVSFENKKLTYHELNMQVNRLSNYLIKIGVTEKIIVAIAFERSINMIISILAILKAGGAYLPLDFGLPEERIRFMLKEAEVSLILTDENSIDNLSSNLAQIICLEDIIDQLDTLSIENPKNSIDLSSLAYVIYTSGSTGKPKGVMISHLNLINYVSGLLQTLEIKERIKCAYMSTISADLGNTSLYLSLLSGFELHVLPKKYDYDASSLSLYFATHKIDLLKITPTHFEALLDCKKPEQLIPNKFLILGGEIFTVDLLKKIKKFSINKSLIVINHYGPTETTIGCCAYKMHSNKIPDFPKMLIPVGYPLPNVQAYVLDKSMNIAPIGIRGELYVGGLGLARGYLNQATLTTERFIPNPFFDNIINKSTRLYKTGDIASYLSNGAIQILGRIDDQIKLRGFRIELGEIISALESLSSVLQASVIIHSGKAGEKKLIAYVVPKEDIKESANYSETYVSSSSAVFSVLQGEKINQIIKNIKNSLSSLIPEYMIPSTFIFLTSLPLTLNGKLDKKNLPVEQHMEKSITDESPKGYFEEKISEIWLELLEVQKIGRQDDFFELGGHSLLAIQAVSRMQDILNVRFSIREFFEFSTIEKISTYFTMMNSTTLVMEKEKNIEVAYEVISKDTQNFFSIHSLPRIDSIAISELHEGYFKDSKISADNFPFDKYFYRKEPCLVSIFETEFGNIGEIILPIFQSKIYSKTHELNNLILQSIQMGKNLGAKAVSMTGLLPSATNYGISIDNMIQAKDMPKITTGHAVTVSAVLLNIQETFKITKRKIQSESIGFLGLGSIGLTTLYLMLEKMPHPKKIFLCDIYKKLNMLEDIKKTIKKKYKYKGVVDILSSNRTPPQDFYNATTIIGATSVPDILLIDKVKPGTIIIDDSGPPCFDLNLAVERMNQSNDIIFIEAGPLKLPNKVKKYAVRYDNPLEIVNVCNTVMGMNDNNVANINSNQDIIMGCVFSGLLVSKYEQAKPNLGLIDYHEVEIYLELIKNLNIEGIGLRFKDHVFDEGKIKKFLSNYKASRKIKQKVSVN